MYKGITICSFSEDIFVENVPDCSSFAFQALVLPSPKWLESMAKN